MLDLRSPLAYGHKTSVNDDQVAMSTPIGIYLRSLRMRAGLRQEEFAELLGITPSFISSIEIGRKNPTQDFIDRIAALLELTQRDREDLKREFADSPKRIDLPRDLPADEYRMWAELSREQGQLTPGQIEIIRKIAALEDEIRARPSYRLNRIARRDKQTVTPPASEE
jgi:transcriptional regulator with XRE-family HTH domain